MGDAATATLASVPFAISLGVGQVRTLPGVTRSPWYLALHPTFFLHEVDVHIPAPSKAVALEVRS